MKYSGSKEALQASKHEGSAMQNGITSIDQMRASAELSPCGIGLFQIENAAPVFLNHAYYELVGYTPEEYQKLVKDNDMLMYPKDVAISNQNKEMFSAFGETNNAEYRIVRKDGQIRWVKLNASTIEIGGTRYAYTVFTDITREKETYARLMMIAENTNSSISMIQVTDKGEKLVYANEYFYRLTGVSKDEYEKNMQEIDRSLVSPTDHERLLKAAREAFTGNQAGEIEYRLIRPDGKRLWVNRRFRAIRQDDEKGDILFSIVTDISSRKEAEIRMALQQQRFQLVINELNAAVFEWNLQTGSFYSSDAFQNYAISQADLNDILENRGPRDLVHPDDQELLMKFFRDTDADKEKAEVVLRLKMTDESYRWCRMIAFFHKDEAGTPTRTIGVIIDVNDEHEHSFILDNVLNAMPGGVGIFGFGKTVTCEYYSDSFARMGGYTRAQIDEILENGRVLESLIAPVDFQKVSHSFAEKTVKGLPINMNYRFLHQDRSVHWLHLSASKMRDIDGVPYYYCIFTNPPEETAMYRSIVEDSAIGVFVGERASRTMLYSNPAMHEIFGFSPQSSHEGYSVFEILNKTGEQPFLTQEQVSSLRTDTYTIYQVEHKGRYFSIRAKAVVWNDVDAYVLYLTDETAEHKNQLRLQKLVDEVPGGIGIYDIVDGKVNLTYLNNAYYEMLGMTRESRSLYYGLNAMEAAYEDDRPVLLAKIQEMIDGKDRTGILHRVRNGDGHWIWLNLEASVVERDSHHIRVYASFSNCDELIRSQEALRTRYEDQVRYAKNIASNALGSSMANLTKQTITMQSTENDGVLEIISNKTPQQGFEAMYPCIPDEEIREEYAQIFDSDRIMAAFAKGIESKSIRHPYMSFECWYESTYNVVLNPQTNDLEVYCVARDVSKEVQEEFVNQQIMSKAYDEVILIDQMTGKPQPLVTNNKSGIYEIQQKLGDYNLGLQRFIMSNCTDEHPEQIAEALSLKAVKAALQKQDSYTVTYSLYNQRHEIVRRTASYTYLNKYKLKLLCVIQDITSAVEKESRQREALREALAEAQSSSRAKADFYSRMSHDLRTPMNGILGMAELSKDETDMEKLRSNIQKIHESGEYLLSLINDTLDIQRIESGKLKLERQIVHTAKTVSSILEMVQPLADAKGVNLQFDKGNTDINWYVRTDPVRIKQIFINLLSNAIKFTPSGGTVKFTSQLLGREEMISHDVFTISDTGIGMSPDFLKNGIFKPFSQESNAVTAQYAGSGLGLSIAKKLVELMGGSISVESEPGVGTTFTVTLDFERVNKEEVRTATQNSIVQNNSVRKNLQGKKLLLVEDHTLNAEIAIRMLEKEGCEVDWLQNGAEAVRRFEEDPDKRYDLVLMDIRMPVMDGLEAAKRIRALPSDYAKAVPIIAMTANAYEEDIRRSLEVGMNAHLSKPIEKDVFYDTIQKCILNREPHDERQK